MQFYETPEHSLAAAITLPMISSATVALRFYTRKKQKLPPQIDDWLTLPPLVLTYKIMDQICSDSLTRYCRYFSLGPVLQQSSVSPRLVHHYQLKYLLILCAGVQQHALGYPTPDVPIPEGHFPGDRPDLFVVVPVVVVASRVCICTFLASFGN